MGLKNCPQKYYDNCKNAVYKCNLCRAGTGKTSCSLHYKPINPDIIDHPANTKPKKKNNYSKSGYKTEKKVVSDFIKATLNSGSVLGDGDFIIGDHLNMDVKKRHKTSSFTVSNQEYKTAIQKGQKGWVIENKEGERVVFIREKYFLQLLRQLNVIKDT